MTTRPTVSAALLFTVLSVGCGGTPQVRYQAGDKNAVAGQVEEWTFDKDAAGKPPAGAEVFGGTWEVKAASDSPSPPNALCQTATAEYPAIRFGDTVYADLVATVRFKPVSGTDDRAAGIIFRVQDAKNYYILRANALEDNVILFRFAGGSRSTIKSGSAKVPSGRWQELKVEVEGKVIRTGWSLEPGSRTLRTEIDLPNEKEFLRPGMYVHAKLTAELPAAWSVPAAAIGKAGDDTIMYLAEGGKAVRVTVQPLKGDGHFSQVRRYKKAGATDWTDVTGGEQIATPASALSDGQAIP